MEETKSGYGALEINISILVWLPHRLGARKTNGAKV